VSILAFEGEYRWLSNFWPSPIVLDGKDYPTVEHAYQALKFADPAIHEAIRTAKTAGIAKRLGKGAIGKHPNWSSNRLVVMRRCLVQKFRIPELKEKLLATVNLPLVEGNRWGDTFYGVCNGEGENHLGKMLMEIREDIRKTDEMASYFI
jgi:ribA/ribD-fused uncharacterized protein